MKWNPFALIADYAEAATVRGIIRGIKRVAPKPFAVEEELAALSSAYSGLALTDGGPGNGANRSQEAANQPSGR